MPGYHRGRPPGNKSELYPADPTTVEEIVALMRSIGDCVEGHRLRALTVQLGAPACGSAKRWHCTKATWIALACGARSAREGR